MNIMLLQPIREMLVSIMTRKEDKIYLLQDMRMRGVAVPACQRFATPTAPPGGRGKGKGGSKREAEGKRLGWEREQSGKQRSGCGGVKEKKYWMAPTTGEMAVDTTPGNLIYLGS